MTFLAPWWLLGLALVPALLLWGLLAPRGRPVTVGSLMLWRRALAGGAAGRPTARLRLRDPLLWLDASCILFVILACARPALETARPLDPVATVVLDRTASMAMPSNGPRGLRWQDAGRMLANVLAEVGDAPVRVVHVPGPAGVVLAEKRPADDVVDWYGSEPRALLAAEDVWHAASAEAVRRPDRPVLAVTDVAPKAALPENVFVLATGGPSHNVGLMHVGWRGEHLDGGGYREWLLVKARAAASAPGTYDLRVYGDDMGLGGLSEIKGLLAPGERVERIVSFADVQEPEFGPVVCLEGPGDGFPEDDRAYLAAPPRRPIRVRLVGEAPEALSRALRACGNVQVTEAMPPASPTPDDTDLVVAYATGIPDGWDGPAVVVAPPEEVGPVRPTGREVKAEWRVAEDHPLADALYLPAPRVGRVPAYTVADDAAVAVGSPDAPLIVTWGNDRARRLAVLFDLAETTTDWPRRASFPIFWSAAMDSLVPDQSAPTDFVVLTPAEVAQQTGGPLPGGLGGSARASFIGTDEGFQTGPGRDDSASAIAAIHESVERCREATLAPGWPYAAALAVLALLARAWVAR